MATVLDSAVTPALKELGVLAAGETASSEDTADALAALNRLVDQWAAERLFIYTTTRATWTITSGTYTVAGTATQPRPIYIDHVSYVDAAPTPDFETPLVQLTDDGWALLATKDLTATRPTHWHYEPSFPNGILTLYPDPTEAGLTGVLYVPQAVAQFAALTTTLSLPPGYGRMIVKNLALELGPSYGKQPDIALVAQALEARVAVRRANRRLEDLSFDAGALAGGVGGWDIHTDS